MIWIGFVVVVLASGQTVADASFFPDEQACKDASADLIKKINEPESHVMGYEIECKRLDKMKKPGANV